MSTPIVLKFADRRSPRDRLGLEKIILLVLGREHGKVRETQLGVHIPNHRVRSSQGSKFVDLMAEVGRQEVGISHHEKPCSQALCPVHLPLFISGLQN
jgi:hypothetical protein